MSASVLQVKHTYSSHTNSIDKKLKLLHKSTRCDSLLTVSCKDTCCLYFSVQKLMYQFLLVHYLKLYKPLWDNLITYVILTEHVLLLVRHDTGNQGQLELT